VTQLNPRSIIREMTSLVRVIRYDECSDFFGQTVGPGNEYVGSGIFTRLLRSHVPRTWTTMNHFPYAKARWSTVLSLSLQMHAKSTFLYLLRSSQVQSNYVKESLHKQPIISHGPGPHTAQQPGVQAGGRLGHQLPFLACCRKEIHCTFRSCGKFG
jgi:hypothetical protein